MVEIKLKLSQRGSTHDLLEEALEGVSLDVTRRSTSTYILFGGESAFDDLESNLEDLHSELEADQKHVKKDRVEHILKRLDEGLEVYHVQGASVE